MCFARRLVSLLLLFGAGGAIPVAAADRYDPRLRFRTIRTAHFDIHAHQGEEAPAARLAAIAERVRARFAPDFGVARGRVHVILVDQTDLSNGWATPLPYDTIEVTAAPPPAESLIGNTTDWLELVFTHEYTHILHLDRSRGLMQGVRRLFGRVPLAFPNLFLPTWQVEGIATFEESRLTGAGRVPAGDFRAIVDLAAARGRFEPIDRAGGGLNDWPSGHAAYAYGAYFHQFLADTYGPEKLPRLADATAGRLPLFGSGAFRKVFGRSSGTLWNDFREARRRAGGGWSETDARATRLTHHGFTVTAPALATDGTIYYSLAGADGFPALMKLTPGGPPRRVAWRTLGSRTSVRGGWIVFDQLERVRSVALFSDLYALPAGGGALHRLTRNARAGDPDLSPDGRRIVCTVLAAGRRALAMFDFSPAAALAPQLLIDDPDADYSGPRWSPDGRQLIAARRRPGVYELVQIDPESRAVRVVVSRSDARLVTPSWSPDGSAILFAATEGDAPFNLFAADVDSGRVRRVTDTAGGAQFPELSPSGTLTYVGYTPDGYDLFSVSLDLASVRAQADDRSFSADLTAASPAAPASPAGADHLRPYQPIRTLVPTFWTPLVARDSGEVVVGAATAMADALGRHAYAVDAAWSGSRFRPDWHAAYAYDRWRPTLFASYADDTDPVRGGVSRSRELKLGTLVPFRHVRWTETLMAAFAAESATIRCAAGAAPCSFADASRDLRSLRGGWLHDSRRLFGYSISPEEGFAVEAVAEASRAALGSDVDASAAVFDGRAYRRLFGRHTVLAGRVAIAAAWGPSSGRRSFSASGSGPSNLVFDLDRGTVGLLRGVPADDLIGSRAAVANLDLRFPLARIQRGRGSWPVFLRALHGAAFVDAGRAWDSAFRASDLRTSVGAELSLDLVVVHYLPVTLVSGAAWTRDPRGDRQRAALFGRLGYAF